MKKALFIFIVALVLVGLVGYVVVIKNDVALNNESSLSETNPQKPSEEVDSQTVSQVGWKTFTMTAYPPTSSKNDAVSVSYPSTFTYTDEGTYDEMRGLGFVSPWFRNETNSWGFGFMGSYSGSINESIEWCKKLSTRVCTNKETVVNGKRALVQVITFNKTELDPAPPPHSTKVSFEKGNMLLSIEFRGDLHAPSRAPLFLSPVAEQILSTFKF